MVKESIKTAKTVDEAIDAACLELGVDREAVEFEIIDLPKKSMMGLKFTPAKVRVTVNVSKCDVGLEFLREMISGMGLDDVEIESVQQENGAQFILKGDSVGILIGRRGETLDAIQYLVSLVANRSGGDYYRISIDTQNYRVKREKTLEALALKIAKQVLRNGSSVTLEPMNPYERRIVHAAIQNVEGVKSASIGEEPNRKVVISSTNPRPVSSNRPPYNRNNYKNGGNRDNRQGRGGYNKPYANRNAEAKPATVKTEPKPQPPKEAYDLPLYSKIDL